MAQRTEWTRRDLTSKASPEVSVGSKMMCIVDRTWDGSWFVDPMSGTRICTQWSDMLIFACVNYFCSRIRVLCVVVFRESLEWRSGAKPKIRQLGIPVGFVRSPWLVVSVFRHGSLSNSLPLSFGDRMTYEWPMCELRIN